MRKKQERGEFWTPTQLTWNSGFNQFPATPLVEACKGGIIMRLILMAAILLLNMGNAWAGLTDGNKLHQWLLEEEKPNGSSLEIGLSYGYVNGVLDMGNGILFCIAEGVTMGQLIAIVTKHLKDNPEKWNQPAQFIVINAMKSAFPCKK